MKKQYFVVIDDSPSILCVLKGMFAELGYDDVITSSNPIRALELIKKSPKSYRAVFTDLNMPEIDGMEVLRQLGEMGYNGGVCIISDLEDRVLELAANVARQHEVRLIGSIPKPIASSELNRAVNKLIQLEQKTFSHFKKMTKAELIDCIKKRLITPYYQPKVNILTRRVESVEALARICKPGETDAILPGRFIPTASEHGLLDTVTEQVVTQSLNDLPRLKEELGSGLHLALNLSPTQLTNPEYPEQLFDIVAQSRVNPAHITIEVTEEDTLKSTEQLECLNRFRIKGFGLSLDDFGTGYTNLQQLRTLPFTEVKVDRSLVSNIHIDRFNQIVVSSLRDICKNLPISLVAEGVENYEDYNYLESHHTNVIAQGFLICKPRSLESLFHWYASWNKVIDIR
ncbi:EAL domain-containing response regulator [Vibrio coralliilyticus]|uniref:EAL domain-containing response regulator n=1 Tax=Vibrio TaxID=662 RepID=UPI0005003B6F|nr:MULTISPECIES: EAL domain-containing response regulator [Vibrio]KFI09467.1 diguanylate phosphodiesterase [Vibrio sp. B183]NOI21139.1 EAL domain-containing response regulator [Vibrio coralliilyticus]